MLERILIKASEGDPTWLGEYGNTFNNYLDDAATMTIDKNTGDLYIVGSMRFSGSGYINDSVILKISKTGVILWKTQIFINVDNNRGYSICIDPTGFVYVITNIYTDACLITKHSASNGSLIWQKRLNGTTGASSRAALDSSGNLYIVGGNSYIAGDYSTFGIVKLTSAGVIIWQRGYYKSTPSVGMYASNITIDGSGNIYIVGAQYVTGNTGQQNAFLIKYDSSGTFQWHQMFGAVGSEETFSDAVCDAAGNIYVTGYISTNSYDTILVKYNSSGTVQFQKFIGSPSNFEGGSKIAIQDENLYILIRITNNTTGRSNYGISKINTSGSIQWIRRFSQSVNFDMYVSENLAVSNNNVYTAAARTYGSFNQDLIFVASLPQDGSKTATYSLTGSNVTYSDFSPDVNTGDISLTNISQTYTSITTTSFSLTDTSYSTQTPTLNTETVTVI